MNLSPTVSRLLRQWVHLHTLGRKPRSQEFNQEIAEVITTHWPGYLNAPANGVTAEQLQTFTVRVTHYCPSRWNAIVSALRFITPAAHVIPKRAIRLKERRLLSHEEFETLRIGRASCRER